MVERLNLELEHEIRNKKLVEEALIEEECIMHSLWENSPYILMILDENGVIQVINHLLANQMGLCTFHDLAL